MGSSFYVARLNYWRDLEGMSWYVYWYMLPTFQQLRYIARPCPKNYNHFGDDRCILVLSHEQRIYGVRGLHDFVFHTPSQNSHVSFTQNEENMWENYENMGGSKMSFPQIYFFCCFKNNEQFNSPGLNSPKGSPKIDKSDNVRKVI